MGKVHKVVNHQLSLDGYATGQRGVSMLSVGKPKR